MLRQLLSWIGMTVLSSQAPAQLELGQPFPLTAFADAETGKLSSVADFRGKPLLLHLYASW